MHQRHKVAFSVIGQCVHFHVSEKITARLIGEDEFKAHFGPEEIAEHVCRMCLASLGLAPPIVESRPGSAGQPNPADAQAASANTAGKEGT